MSSHHGSTVRRRWFTAVTIGGFLGFTVPAVVGALVLDASIGVAVMAIAFAGAAAGIVLGAFQAAVLRPLLTGFRVLDWVAASAAGTAVAWAVVLLPVRQGERMADWPATVQMPVAVAGELVIVFALGVAQWVVLRRWTDRAVLWVLANAVGWIAGLVVVALINTALRQLGQPGQTWAVAAGIGVLSGLGMAIAMAAVTGAFLGRVLAVAAASGQGRRSPFPWEDPRSVVAGEVR